MSTEKINAKRFLLRYRIADKKIRMLLDEIEKIEELAAGRAIQIDGQPHGSGKSDMVANAASLAADLRKELTEWVLEQEAIKRQVISVLGQLTDAGQIQVLQLRYMTEEGENTWINIAYAMDKSVTHVQRIHGRALEEVQKILDSKPVGWIEKDIKGYKRTQNKMGVL